MVRLLLKTVIEIIRRREYLVENRIKLSSLWKCSNTDRWNSIHRILCSPDDLHVTGRQSNAAMDSSTDGMGEVRWKRSRHGSYGKIDFRFRDVRGCGKRRFGNHSHLWLHTCQKWKDSEWRFDRHHSWDRNACKHPLGHGYNNPSWRNSMLHVETRSNVVPAPSLVLVFCARNAASLSQIRHSDKKIIN